MPTSRELTPLGELLERAREDVLHVTVREAARRAGVSEARWRQVVTGWQPTGGGRIPANPRVRTVVAMALAVQVDVANALALTAAGAGMGPGAIASIERDVRSALGLRPALREPIPDLDLDAEIERIARLDIPARTKILLLRTVVDLHEQAQAEQRREPSNTHCDKETG